VQGNSRHKLTSFATNTLVSLNFYNLTPWSRIIPEEVIGSQLANKLRDWGCHNNISEGPISVGAGFVSHVESHRRFVVSSCRNIHSQIDQERQI
jgi:hypothetical protein